MKRSGWTVAVIGFVLFCGTILLLRHPLATFYHLEMGGHLLSATLGPEATGPLDPGTILRPAPSPDRLIPAAEHFRAALNQDKENMQACRLLGRTAAWRGEYDTALTIFRYCRTIRPGDPLVPLEEAAVYRALARTDPQRARQGLREAWRDAGVSPAALIRHGEDERTAGNLDEALFWYDQALALDPGAGEAWYRIGLVRAAQMDWGGAVDAYQQAEATLPDDGHLQFEWGWAVYQQTGDARLGEPYLRRAVALLPDEMWPLLRLVALLRAEGRLDEAVELVHYAERRFPADPWPLIYEGRFALLRGNPQRARKTLQRVIEWFPPQAEAYFLVGQTYAQERNWPQAIAALQRAIALDPQHDYIFEALGQVYLASGQIAQARAAFEKALTQNAQNENALKGLQKTEEAHP
ncbi:MAG: tetratricopeptide repeat protein [Chloroflexi bacterium]|nr:tetratricopeptide repeat protein [Chloroflexota bacterium]